MAIYVVELGAVGPPGTGGGGSGVPDGGTTGQPLRKNSDTNGDAGWGSITLAEIADAGTAASHAATDFDAAGAAATAQSAAEAASDPVGTAAAAVATEATARAGADSTLASAITTEAGTRATADTTNANAISTEATARAGADSTEATARIAGDATNATAITNEATARAGAITTEAAARVAGDAAITPTSLGLVIGTNVEAHDSDLTAIAALDSSTAGAIASDGSGWVKKTYAQLKTALGLVKGDVGLGNVDNTSDVNKPVSTAQATADAVNATAITTEASTARAAESANATAITSEASTARTAEGLRALASRQVVSGTGLSGGGDLTADRTLALTNVGTAGTKGSGSLVPQLTTDAQGRVTGVVEVPIIVARVGCFRNFTHSYGSYSGVSSNVFPFDNFIRRVSAAYGVQVAESDYWYHAGMFASLPNIGDTAASGGIGGLFRHAYPDHIYGPPGLTAPAQGAKASPFTDLICLGVNDDGGSFGPAAAQQGMRAVLARLRAGRIYAIDNAAFAFGGSGWGSVLVDKNYVSFQKYKSTATANDTLTFTIPTTFTGGVIALSLLGNTNASTTIASGSNGVNTSTFGGSGTLNVADTTNYPSSGQLAVPTAGTTAQVSYTGKTGTTFTGCTTLSGGGVMATGGTVTRSSSTAALDFTGSTSTHAAAHANVTIAAVGNSATDIQMVVRFTNLDSTDAGSTIVAKLVNPAANEFFRPFDIIIEDIDPPTQLLVNQPLPPAHLSSATRVSRIATINSNITSLAAEFSGAYVVDVAATFSAYFGGVIQTATGTGEASIKVTPNSQSLNVWTKGSILNSGGEVFLVTAIDKTNGGANDGTWILTVATNYTGGDAPTGGAASTGNANHAVGANIVDCLPWSTVDGLHPSALGHALYAAQVITTLNAVPQTARIAATSGGYKANEKQAWAAPVAGVAQRIYRPSLGATRATILLTLNKEIADPFRINSTGLIVTFDADVTTGGSAGAVLRFGLYTNGPGCPGSLIFDSGTVVSTVAAAGAVTISVFIPVTPGIYWRSMVSQGAVCTVRGCANHSGVADGLTIPAPASDLTSTSPPGGMSRASITGALTDWDPTVQTVEVDQVFPMIWCGYETFITA